ncbi:MAG: hypothetical protein JWM33_3382, partial [Caulobacteraceae bacterium]|nr:hypothetical protein [Caulobacteraceae bacterium]
MRAAKRSVAEAPKATVEAAEAPAAPAWLRQAPSPDLS